jgi:hypothetical protein
MPRLAQRRVRQTTLAGLVLVLVAAAQAHAALPAARVTIALDRPLASFAPASALGAGLDGHGQGETAQIYTPANVRAMDAAGLRSISYRLRTELGVEAWHWNTRGRWSDPRRRQGYWTSSAQPGAPTEATYGYRLPRRGDTFDQANDDGFSRLDDGDPRTFWKSDPYLDPRFTQEPGVRHAQWIVVDLGRARPVDALELDWAAPYARRVRVDRWVGHGDPTYDTQLDGWRPFPHAAFRGRPGRQPLRLAAGPRRARWVRILLSDSSHTAPRGSRDVRDRLGFAVRELRLGRIRGGRLRDLLVHAPSNARQSPTYVSSTDPWHRARDRDPSTEQPSFQTVQASGLAHGLPLLVPVPVLYGTPADAAGELRYLHRLGIPLRGVELGEEPDGQLATPEDYGSLYAQFSRALRRADRRVPLGGPGFQSSLPDWSWWPNARGDHSWMHRFLAELRARGALARYDFFSFEWYPFDDVCGNVSAQLAKAPGLLASLLASQRRAGLPARFPTIVTEYGYSAYAAQAEVDLPGALLDADLVGSLLTDGGSAAYLYSPEPDVVMRETDGCSSWGNLTLLASDDQHRIRFPTAAFWASQMLTQDWTAPQDPADTLLTTHLGGPASVTAYALRRPDGSLSLLLLNKGASPLMASLGVVQGGGPRRALQGAAALTQLSRAQYAWHAAGARGFASPDGPPARSTAALGTAGHLVLPPLSLTVLRLPAAASD